MDKRPVGVIDSGIGGLTIVREIIDVLPQESILYIGDSLNSPYGAKIKEEIHALSNRLVHFLLKTEVKTIVVACNTITVSCIDKLRSDHPQIPIIGTVPVVKSAVSVTKNKKIGVLSTTRTANSNYQKNLIRTFSDGCEVFNYGTDELVPLIEKGEFESEKMYRLLKRVLARFQKEGVDTLVMGCTHFPILREQINKILEGVEILDSGPAIGRQVSRILASNGILSKEPAPVHEFITTGNEKHMDKMVKKLISENSSARKIRI